MENLTFEEQDFINTVVAYTKQLQSTTPSGTLTIGVYDFIDLNKVAGQISKQNIDVNSITYSKKFGNNIKICW